MHFARFRKVALAALSVASLGLAAGRGPDARAASDAPGRPKGGFAGPPEALVATGDQRLATLRYDEAVTLYRRYLRRAPKDYKVWSKLGAAYFYTGQPRKALKNLKHVERRTPEKSYNYYYQGLCHLLLGQPQKARDYLQYAGQKFKDDWGAKAVYEMAVLEYKAKAKDKALYWLALYLERSPKGASAEEVRRLSASLKDDAWVDDARGTPLPDTEKAQFKYSNLSFTARPHYWFLSGGARFEQRTGKEPDQGGKIKDSGSTDETALFSMGAGLGPLRYGNTTVTSGYTYKQSWHTDADRAAEWLQDWTDFVYFPLRSDLLERRHQIFVDVRHDLGSSYYFGVYGRYELARIGSSIFPNPETLDLQQVIPVSDTQLVIPWFGISWNNTTRTLAYLYARKEINDNQPAYSNETVSLVGDAGRPTGSIGLSHTMDFPEVDTTVDLEVFHYEFVYNDKFLDYARNGFFASAENRLFLSLQASLLFGYYADTYVRDRPKAAGSCGAQPDILPGTTAPQPAGPDLKAKPIDCERNDTGLLLQAGAAWTFSQYNRLDGFIQIVQNDNAELEEYQEQKVSAQVGWTMAFPSVKRVSRIVDRYADSAFTKEAK